MVLRYVVFTDDFKTTPYWWDGQLPGAWDDEPVPDTVDVAVIGGGYTGLHAAFQTARAGLKTVVFDAGEIGFGCSTRNGGQVSPEIAPPWSLLLSQFGEQRALEVAGEGVAAMQHLRRFVDTHAIDCAFDECGMFHAAHSNRAWQRLRRAPFPEHGLYDAGARLVPEEGVSAYLGTRRYAGGVVLPDHASLDPARYHAGLAELVRESGAGFCGMCEVRSIERQGDRYLVAGTRGTTRAKRVIVATNGYTGSLMPWLQRRVVPIGSYVIATEELPPDLMDEVMPTDCMITDTRKLVYYYRPSPDRKRILFGGRVSLREVDARVSGAKLRQELVRLFPQLDRVRVSHSWVGYVAFAFDGLTHCGERDGILYAMCYSGSGVALAGYLGEHIGRRAAGDSSARTAFDSLEFGTLPLYTGNPWFLAPSIMAYRVIDRLT